MQGVMSAVLPTLLGFGLGQLVNLFALGYRLWMKPCLCIQRVGDNHVLLDHGNEVSAGQIFREIVYGFEIQNRGRSVAHGVRAFLVKTEIRDKDEPSLARSQHTPTHYLGMAPGRTNTRQFWFQAVR